MTKKLTPRERFVNQFMVRVAEGMAGWISFVQAAHLSPMYSESFSYLPIFQIAHGRGWQVRPQRKLHRGKTGRGRFKTVDFAFQHAKKDVGAFLEVKFARVKATHCLQVTKDIYKLAKLTPQDISEKKPPNAAFKFLLIIGQRHDITSRIESRASIVADLTVNTLARREDKRLVKQLARAFKNETRSPSAAGGWVFSGLGANWRYYAVLLSQEGWWNSLHAKLSLTESETAEDDSDEEEALADDLQQLTNVQVDDI